MDDVEAERGVRREREREALAHIRMTREREREKKDPCMTPYKRLILI
jgi:hypothetical protein